MRSPLKNNDKITGLLYSSCEPNRLSRDFTLTGVIGIGSNCIAYDAWYIDSVGSRRDVVLKEFIPKSIAYREGGKKIFWTDSEASTERQKKQFIQSYKANIELLHQSANLGDYIVRVEELYDCPETDSCFYTMVKENESLANYLPDSLHEAAEIIKAITETVCKVHEAGYLVIDLKPENVLITKGTGTVKLFDLDSLIDKKQIRDENCNYAFSSKYAAPEVLKVGYDTKNSKLISDYSDYFVIGVVAMILLLGESQADELLNNHILYGEAIPFDNIRIYGEKANSGTQKALSHFFAGTLTPNYLHRFGNDDEMLDAIRYLCNETDCELVKARQKRKITKYAVTTVFAVLLAVTVIQTTVNYKRRVIDTDITYEGYWKEEVFYHYISPGEYEEAKGAAWVLYETKWISENVQDSEYIKYSLNDDRGEKVTYISTETGEEVPSDTAYRKYETVGSEYILSGEGTEMKWLYTYKIYAIARLYDVYHTVLTDTYYDTVTGYKLPKNNSVFSYKKIDESGTGRNKIITYERYLNIDLAVINSADE